MKRVFVNEEVCMACHLCEVYCRLQHSKSRDLVKAFNKEDPQSVTRLQVQVRKPVSFAMPCRHCQEPQCVYACLTGALQRSADGSIIVDGDKCIGCWTCMLACPYGAIRQETGQGKIVKCDLCPGADMPACVANCPNEALTYAEASEAPVQK